jgi:hypothetical protein
MSTPTPELSAALSRVLDKIDGTIRGSGYQGPPILMYLAGGMAVNYYCGSRYTEDIDASFSTRIALVEKDLAERYQKGDGTSAILYFDANYNPNFALMHPDYQTDSQPWIGIGNERRLVQLNVLASVDLAVSKISRFSAQDREDIRTLAYNSLVTTSALRQRAEEAMSYYVGNLANLRRNLDEVYADLALIEPRSTEPGMSL